MEPKQRAAVVPAYSRSYFPPHVCMMFVVPVGPVRCVQFHAQQGGRGLPAVDLAASVLETLSRKGSDPSELQV